MAAKFIMIASSKGGVGKSTVALGISKALYERGKKVLLCDLDFGNASLDMLLGLQDSVVCTLQDVAQGDVSVEKALIRWEPKKPRRSKRFGGKSAVRPKVSGGELWLLPSSVGGIGCVAFLGGEVCMNDMAIIRALTDGARQVDADFVILDTGAGVNSALGIGASVCDSALVVTGQMPIALRSAESTVARLNALSVKDVKLVINSFDAAGVIEDARRGLFAVIDESRAPLAGVVPYDYSLLLTHEGLSLSGGDGETAFSNIALRIMGNNVPLFSRMKRIRKLKKKICL